LLVFLLPRPWYTHRILQETRRIEDQLNRSFRGPAWHGPSLQELLGDLPFDRAAARPVGGAHSIWEIVLHISAWLRAVRRRLDGEVVQLKGAEDWPSAPGASEAAWRMTLGDLESAHENLRGAIVALDEARLEETAPGKRHSIYFTLHGVIQHNIYHAGQIAILKKA
jgi:uncharacterized damage-inducible protein DinB